MNARSLVVSLTLTAALLVASRAARAEKPNPAFRGRVMLSDKRFPTQAKSLSAFNAKVRRQSRTSFREDKEDKSWKIYFAAFLKAPLNDLEYLVKLYEITGGRAQRVIDSFEQFTDRRGRATLMSSMKLERKQVGVNKELMISIEYKGRVLATGRFKIIGEAERYTGKVDFSEDEANGKGEE